MRIHTTAVIGCGGTGSHLIPSLHRLIAFHPNAGHSLVLIDGDQYEQGNAERQMFSPIWEGTNKAVAQKTQLPNNNDWVESLPNYVHAPDTIGNMLVRRQSQDGVYCMIICVDNDASRKIIYEGIDRTRADVFVIDCANELDVGSVATWMRVWNDGVSIETSSHPRERYPQLQNPVDHPPGGCYAKTPSTPQLITANMLSAWGALQAYMNVLDDKPFSAHWQFDCRRMRADMLDDPIQVEV